MQNLKIKVNNETESKEVQGLFFSLGYGFEGNEIKEIQDFEYVGEFYFFAYGDDCDLTHSCDSVLFTTKPHKEITLPELRAMVNPVKEYLIPSRNYEYILTDAREALEPHAKDWISIPDKYNFLYVGTRGDRAWTSEPANCYGELVWQRPTQPEPLPFIDDNPQSLNDQYAEIEQVRQQTIEATLAERQAQYGCFEDVAFVTENIMAVLSKARTNGLSDLPHTHRMALYMIASKMSRIVNGDFNHLDSWHDIGGYSKLIEKLINGE